MRTIEDLVAWILTGIIFIGIAYGVSSCRNAYADEVVIQTIAMEAANQLDDDAYGQYAVASVIVNRSRQRGQTLEEVCLARKQFSCWNDPKWAKTWLDNNYTIKTRWRASKALKRAILEPIKGVNHYHTVSVKPCWAKGKTPSYRIGEHLFYNL